MVRVLVRRECKAMTAALVFWVIVLLALAVRVVIMRLA
jgi:hypothetical protein